MEQLQFHVRGISDNEVRHWKRRTSPRGRFLTWAAIGVVGYILLGPSTASIRGASVSAYRVLVLVDDSTSMPDFNAAVRPQLDRFRAAGIPIDYQANVPGWSWGSNSGYGFLRELERAIAAGTTVDTVYVVSDFTAGDNTDNDAAGERRLRQLLGSRGLRVYFSSVRDPVPLAYRQIAESTGGGVVR